MLSDPIRAFFHPVMYDCFRRILGFRLRHIKNLTQRGNHTIHVTMKIAACINRSGVYEGKLLDFIRKLCFFGHLRIANENRKNPQLLI